MVHRIVEAHRGGIEVAAPAGGGAAFTVLLPLAEP
jgi:signal transduction histidine kinase